MYINMCPSRPQKQFHVAWAKDKPSPITLYSVFLHTRPRCMVQPLRIQYKTVGISVQKSSLMNQISKLHGRCQVKFLNDLDLSTYFKFLFVHFNIPHSLRLYDHSFMLTSTVSLSKELWEQFPVCNPCCNNGSWEKYEG